MAIKSSGALYLYNDIGRYFGVGASNVSLRNLSSRAGKGTPDAMSEFYGYGGGPTPPPPVVAPPPPVATPPPPVATPPPVTPPPTATPPPPTTPPTTPPPTTPPPTTPPPTAPPPVTTRPPAITCAPLPDISYDTFSPASACEAFPTQIFSNVGDLCDNSGQGRLYSNNRCTQFAPPGYYSRFSNEYRYWAGQQYTSLCGFCNF